LRQRILFVGSPCIDESSIGLLSHVNRREALLSLQVAWRSLAALEKRLPSKLFFRANRSQILNLSCIESVVPWFNNGLKVRLYGGQEVEIARRPAKLFREKLRF
jgi:two-component system LytT family response regulator